MAYQMRRPNRAEWETLSEAAVRTALSGTFWVPEDAIEALHLGIHVQLFTGEIVRSEDHEGVQGGNRDGAWIDKQGILWP